MLGMGSGRVQFGILMEGWKTDDVWSVLWKSGSDVWNRHWKSGNMTLGMVTEIMEVWHLE